MKVRLILSLIMASLLALSVGGCGGGGGGGAPAVTNIPVTASQTTVVADNVTTSTITADLTGQGVSDGAPVTFAIAAGTATLSSTSALVSGGKASVAVKSATPGVVIVSATYTQAGLGTFSGTSPGISFVPSSGVLVTPSKQVALANNTDLITITASFTNTVTSATFTATPVVAGGSNGANALFTNNTNSITVNAAGGGAVSSLSTTVRSGTIGGSIITVTSGSLVGTAYVKFISQPTSVDVSVTLTSTDTFGVLQYNLTNSPSWFYAANSALAVNAADGSLISAVQNVAGTSTSVGLVNTTGFVPTTAPIEILTYDLDLANPVLNVLPTFTVSNAPGTLIATNPLDVPIILSPANFKVTLKFNTDTF